MDSSKNSIDLNISKESKNRLSSLPLSEYAEGLDSKVVRKTMRKNTPSDVLRKPLTINVEMVKDRERVHGVATATQ